MTRLAWIADVHLGNHKRHGGASIASLNVRCREAVEVFDRAVRSAVALRCDALFVLGDLLDYQRPEAQLITLVQKPLAWAHDEGLRIFILVGNHDQTSSAPGDHALGPLAPYACIVDKPLVARVDDVEIGLIPFRAGAPALEWLPDAVKGLTFGTHEERRLLGVHLGISDDRTPPWLRGAPDSIGIADLAAIAARHSVEAVFAGNWHDRKLWTAGDIHVFQCGALVPTGWDNPGLDGYGTLALWDNGAIEYEEIPGPRFLKLRVGDDESWTQATEHRVYVSMTAPREELAEAQTWLETMKASGSIAAGEVEIDTAEATVAARTAATVARSAETLEEALAGFVAEMPLDESVDRGAVLTAARGYLGRARG